MNSGYDAYPRRSTIDCKIGSTTVAGATYGYDNASRRSSVTDGMHSATYGHLVNSSLISTTTFRTSGSTRLTTTRQYDFLERLQSIGSVPSGGSQLAPSFMYQYTAANQRIRVTREDGSSWVYGDDGLCQVTSGKRVWSDNTRVPGQLFEYQFDDIGNGAKVGGSALVDAAPATRCQGEIASGAAHQDVKFQDLTPLLPALPTEHENARTSIRRQHCAGRRLSQPDFRLS